MKLILDLLSILLWVPAIGIRLALVLLGLLAVPLSLLGDGQYRTPNMWRLWGNVEDIPQWWYDRANENRLAKFWWMAIRNPTHGLGEMTTQPIPEVRPNPDSFVRGAVVKAKSRWMRYKLYSEYWYLRQMDSGKLLEVRIGWKFADGTPGFTPTIQIRVGG